jgi:peptidoglycan LD-endopeptidase LytH
VTLARYQAWLARRAAPAIESLPGVLAGPLPWGELSDRERRPGETIAAGGYGEDRSDYSSDLFRPADGSEPRTVHLGLDIFSAPGTRVFAPLEGIVQSFADNNQPGDYGPTLILEHAPAPGLVFWTLWGHLSRDSLKTVAVGRAVAAGEPIGWLGAQAENGGWPAHLHLQLILDIGSWRGDFPGVAKASERAAWLERCPDPSGLIGVRLALHSP